MNVNKLGKRIAELRRKKNWGQMDLANILGKSTSSIGMWETGKRDPSSEMISKLASAFGVTSDFLLGKEDEIHNNNIKDTTSELDIFIGEIMTATEEERAELIRFWNFMKQKK